MKIIDNASDSTFIGPSNLQGAGCGLFAGKRIMKGVPVCEYKGEVFENIEQLIETGRYNYTLKMGLGRPHAIYTYHHPDLNKVIDCHPGFCKEEMGLGGYINDRLHWADRIRPEYTKSRDEMLEKMQNKTNPQNFEEIEIVNDWRNSIGWNLIFWPIPQLYGAFLISTRTIEAGEELFVDYGDDYWNPFQEAAKEMQKKQSEKKKQEENIPVLKPEDFKT